MTTFITLALAKKTILLNWKNKKVTNINQRLNLIIEYTVR